MKIRLSDGSLLQSLSDHLAADGAVLVDQLGPDTLVVGLIGSYRGDAVRAAVETRVQAWQQRQFAAGRDVTVTLEDVSPARVMLVDDDDAFRAMTRATLEYASGITVVGEATTGSEALRLVDEVVPDVAVVDLSLPLMSGIDVIKRIAATRPDVKIIALTGSEDPADKIAALTAGATHYVTKRRASLAALVQAIVT